MSLEYRIDNRGVVQVQATRKRSFCWPAFVLLLLLLALAATWLYFSGYLTPANAAGGGLQAISLRGKMNEQERLLKEQKEQIIRLESQSATAIRARQVQETAYDELRSKLSLAEAALAEAKQRLLLYDDILSPQDLEPGLHIQHFAVRPRLLDAAGKKLAEGRYYQYHLVLANVRGGDTAVSGHFEVRLSGQQAGKDVVLKLKDLNTTGADGQAGLDRFSLKYYQSIEGYLELPTDFVPAKVEVTLNPVSGENTGKVTRVFEWESFKMSAKSTASKE